MKIIVHAYIYQLIKFDDLMSCGTKDIFKNAPSHVLMYHVLINVAPTEKLQFNTRIYVIATGFELTICINSAISNIA